MHTLKYVMYGMNMGNETIKNWTIFFLLSCCLFFYIQCVVVIGDGNDGGARWNLMGLTPYEQKRQTLFRSVRLQIMKRGGRMRDAQWVRCSCVRAREIELRARMTEAWGNKNQSTAAVFRDGLSIHIVEAASILCNLREYIMFILYLCVRNFCMYEWD